jgi:hypothetical protein
MSSNSMMIFPMRWMEQTERPQPFIVRPPETLRTWPVT